MEGVDFRVIFEHTAQKSLVTASVRETEFNHRRVHSVRNQSCTIMLSKKKKNMRCNLVLDRNLITQLKVYFCFLGALLPAKQLFAVSIHSLVALLAAGSSKRAIRHR